jgi:hypothetical protein
LVAAGGPIADTVKAILELLASYRRAIVPVFLAGRQDVTCPSWS